MVAAPLVLLIESEHAEHHAQSLWRDGFRVVPVPAKDANIGNVLAVRPAIVVAELIAAQAVKTLELARVLRDTPQASPIPFIIYAARLHALDVENAARAGAFWIQLEPGDSATLAAAVRSILRALVPHIATSRSSRDPHTDHSAIAPTVSDRNASTLSSR